MLEDLAFPLISPSTPVFGTAAVAPIAASTLLERAVIMNRACLHSSAAWYGGHASPVAQPTEIRRLPQARVKGKTRATPCGAFHSPEVGSLSILVPRHPALISLFPLLLARDSGSLRTSFGGPRGPRLAALRWDSCSQPKPVTSLSQLQVQVPSQVQEARLFNGV